MVWRFNIHQSVRMAFLAGLGLGLSACVTVNKGMGSLQDSDAVLAVETHSPLDTCLLSKELLATTPLDIDMIKSIELDAMAQTNQFAAIGNSLSGGASYNALFNSGYAGYTADFRGVASLLLDDAPDQAIAYYARRSGNLISGKNDSMATASNVGSLGLITRGALYLDQGDIDCAVELLSAAEALKKDAESGSVFSEFIGKASDYSLEGYERVMLLDQLALSYLLKGDAKAYNVALRASDFQKEQRKIYEKALAEANQEANKQAGQGNQSQGHYQSFNQQDEIKAVSAMAMRVTSPYVNPLAEYISAVMAEIEATAITPRPGIWSEAERAWERADLLYQNNPLVLEGLANASFHANKGDPKAAEKAVSYVTGSTLAPSVKEALQKEVVKPISADERIVHIIGGLGMAPERKIMMMRIPIDDNFISIRIPFIAQVKSKVAKLRVSIGNTTQTLTNIADIEAMIARYDEDGRPLKIFSSLASGFATYYASEQLGGGGLFSMVLNEIGNQVTMPSTLGWQTLPAQYVAARLVVPIGEDKIIIEALDKHDRVLSRQEAQLLPDVSNVIYARSFYDDLLVHKQQKPFTMNVAQQ